MTSNGNGVHPQRRQSVERLATRDLCPADGQRPVHLALIRAGAGIGVCQIPIARRDEAIVRVLPRQFSLPLETWVTMHEDLRNSPRCRVTFDALVKGPAVTCRLAEQSGGRQSTADALNLRFPRSQSRRRGVNGIVAEHERVRMLDRGSKNKP